MTVKRKIQYTLFSVRNCYEGGMTVKEVLDMLKANGIMPCKKTTSAYVGYIGILVPKVFEHHARKLLFG